MTRSFIPAVCDVSVTNACNATCDFCSYAHDKNFVTDRRWIDRAELARALPILHRRGIRYLGFQGGEPLLHPSIDGLVGDARKAGMRPAVITNGWLLPHRIERLIDAGLQTLLVSIDSHSMADHESNRGLKGLETRLRSGLATARRSGITTLASITVNKLVRYETLPGLLRSFGFDAVTFSYPRKERFGSSSLVFGETSPLVDFTPEELVQALESIKALKEGFPVLNPTASIDDIERHVRGESETFACVGGHKHFYVDWNLQIWRCEAWSEPLGSVFDLDRIPDCRDRCTACIMSCYRDASVLMHAGVAIEDAARAAASGRVREAVRLLFRRSVARSIGSLVEEARQISRLARRSTAARPKTVRESTGGNDIEDALRVAQGQSPSGAESSTG